MYFTPNVYQIIQIYISNICIIVTVLLTANLASVLQVSGKMFLIASSSMFYIARSIFSGTFHLLPLNFPQHKENKTLPQQLQPSSRLQSFLSLTTGTGLPASATHPLEGVQNTAGRLVFNLQKCSHITLLRSLR